MRLKVKIVEVRNLVWRETVGVCDDRYSRKRFNAAFEFIPEGVNARGIAILSRRQADGACQQMPGIESHIDVSQLINTGEQQPGDDQQRSCDCKLSANQKLAQSAHSSTPGRR